MGTVDPSEDASHITRDMSMLRAWSPYVIVAALLVLTRAIPEVRLKLESEWVWLVEDIFGTGISQSVQYLFLPGTIFILTCLITYGLHKMRSPEIKETWKVAGKQIGGAAAALLFAVPLVRVFINSGSDFSAGDLASMPLTLAEGAAELAGTNWPILTPWIGALGAFIAAAAQGFPLGQVLEQPAAAPGAAAPCHHAAFDRHHWQEISRERLRTPEGLEFDFAVYDRT